MGRIYGLAATGLTLVGAYLVLKNYTGATAILGKLSSGTVDIYKTLQGR